MQVQINSGSSVEVDSELSRRVESTVSRILNRFGRPDHACGGSFERCEQRQVRGPGQTLSDDLLDDMAEQVLKTGGLLLLN